MKFRAVYKDKDNKPRFGILLGNSLYPWCRQIVLLPKLFKSLIGFKCEKIK